MRQALAWQNPYIKNSKLLIEANVLTDLDNFRQNKKESTEAGGIFLGYRRGIHFHVVATTTPQPKDLRSRFRFHRTDPYHQKTATTNWKSSNMEMDYLGDWHTHPEINPSPSGIDLSEWKKIYQQQKKSMIFLILGHTGNIWVGISHEASIAHCQLVIDSN